MLLKDIKTKQFFLLPASNGYLTGQKLSSNEVRLISDHDIFNIYLHPNTNITNINASIEQDYYQKLSLYNYFIITATSIQTHTDKTLNISQNTIELARIVWLFIERFPNYFWHIPATSSGKNHNIHAQRQNGLVYHTKATIYVCKELITTYNAFDRAYELLMAALLHDSVKYGSEFDVVKFPMHPFLPEEHFKSLSYITGYTTIIDLIKRHMGCISKGSWTEQTGRMTLKPETTEEIILHTADYIASRKRVFINVDRGDA